MKNRYKMFCALSVVATILSSPVSLYAEETETDEQQEVRMNSISPEGEKEFWSEENIAKLNRKIESMKPLANETATTRAGDKILNVPKYTQENGYYCIPACAQIVIQYVRGIKYSQSDLAASMGTSPSYGTYVDSAAPVIAQLTGASYELGNNSQSYFYPNMVADINANYPVIYSVNSSVLNGGPNVGHGVVGIGYGNGQTTWFWDVNPSMAVDIWYCTAGEMSSALNANGGYYIF